ncbi:MAG: ABC transporter ATP-binding protein [Thermoplasmata archaeon]|nr:ABC transporter ATP-binding protein [Thermoplasmata archaeon]
MILKYINRKEWFIALLCVFAITANVYLELEIPDYMTQITTIISTGGEVSEVMKEGAEMLLCALGSLIATIICAVMASYVATSLSKRLRELEFDKVQSFSMEEMDRFSISSLVTRSTNDITQIQMTIAMGLQVMIKAPIMAVWAITKIYSKNLEWTVATAIAVIILMIMIGCVMVFVIPKFRRIQWLTDNVNRVTRENITGIRVIRAYNAEQYQDDRFEAANKDLTDTNLSAQRAMSFMMPGMSAVLNGLSLSIYWIGAFLIAGAASMTDQFVLFADMVVFSSYAMQVIMSFIMLVVIFMIIPRASVAAKRIEEVIDTEPSIVSGTMDGETQIKGKVAFRDVSFRYPGSSEDIVSGLNFEVNKGETLALIGSTGSGKSTVVNMIPRLYDATGGTVEVDGIDVREYDLDTLRSKIGYVSQKAFMFAGTIESNVRYGKDSESATREDVERAISIAQAKDFVEATDKGYDFNVAQGGTNLSGGQKQRLSIARAICKSPEIYIFDDTFSALDYKTDSVLRAELKRHTQGATSIIVAQRVGTIMDADCILVLDEGRIVGRGRHDELIRTCPTYLDIVRSQMSDEEAGL